MIKLGVDEMKTFEQLAQEAYDAMCSHLDRSKEMHTIHSHLEWQELLPSDRDAWLTATRHIVEQANQVH